MATSSSHDAGAWAREFESLGAYVAAKEAFDEWFSFYHKARPIRPGGGDGDGDESVTSSGESDEFANIVPTTTVHLHVTV